MIAAVKPEIAVVIPTLDEEASIERAIRSAERAGASEIVVADGGSTDATESVARSLSAITLRCPAVRGAQLNAGAAATRSPLLAFLHADTELPASAAREIGDAVRLGAEFGGFRLRFREQDLRLRLAETMINLRCRFTRCPWGDQAQWITREAFEQTGGYRDDPIMEDYEMALRMKRRGAVQILESAVTTSGRRFLGKGLIRTSLMNWRIVLLWRRGVPPERLAALYRAR